MTQIFDPLPNNANNQIVCCYVNATSKMQIARITNVPNWYFERVVFPGQRLMFESVPSAQLEIHCGMMASAILSDTIPCERLQVDGFDDAQVDDDSGKTSEEVASDRPSPINLTPTHQTVAAPKKFSRIVTTNLALAASAQL